MALRSGIALADLSPTQVDLEAWLATPPRKLSLELLPSAWRHVVIRVICARPLDLDTRIALLNKVRGALGTALLAGASPAARARLPCPWNPPCALDLLFRQRPLRGLPAGAPPPFTLAADIAGRQLHISLTLFGIAAESCAAEIADALVRGLRDGIVLNAARRVALEVTHREILPCTHINRLPPPAEHVVLKFLTPAGPRSDELHQAGGNAVLRGTFDRVVGLARWLGIEVIEDRSWLDQRMQRISFTGTGLVGAPVQYRRAMASPNGGYHIPPLKGSLAIEGDWQPLWPLLVLGEATHAGGRATQGYGRFRLEAGGSAAIGGDKFIGSAASPFASPTGSIPAS